ncbi:MAG: hypothetical protein IPM46_04925 [Flavobacteriales bacterium]|nr:hypothetical protein [Flavobacteriales bacterium]
MKRIIFLTLAALLLSCGGPAAEPNTKPANEAVAIVNNNANRFGELVLKLLGDWTDEEAEPGAVVHERWSRTDDAFYSGIGFVMVEKDTVFIEHLRITVDSVGVPSYHARIPSQNAGGEIAFRMSTCAGDSMVFENAAHDFPQRISYALQLDGTWSVRVVGPGKDGNLRIERLRFKRRQG